MSFAGAEDGYALNERRESEANNYHARDSRVSSVSEMGSPYTPPVATYDNQTSASAVHKSTSRDSLASVVSPLTEHWSLDQAGPSDSKDAVDVSHVRVDSVSSEAEEQRRFSGALAGIPDILRPGSAPLPRADSSRVSWGPDGPHPAPVGENVFVAGGGGLSGRTRSVRSVAKRLSMGGRHSSIPEESDEIDMGLLSSVSKTPGPQRQRGRSDELDDFGGGAIVDLSSFSGGPLDERAISEQRRLESDGILTGGLGSGVRPDTTVKSQDLYMTIPTREISRRISRGKSTLSRARTIRNLGQSAANKRNEVIEVILEDEEAVPVDISSFSSTVDDFSPEQNRKSTVVTTRTEIFYPQPNWKPFSMRWPYITALVVISVLLALVQEYLFQKSQRQPLFSFISPQDLKIWSFFSFKYLPTIVAVSFGILWQLTDFEVKRLEAFYQLAKDGGALAAESINVDYITYFSFLRPFQALRYKHYSVATSSIATLLAVSLVPTLQSASLVLTPDETKRRENPEVVKEIHINAIWSRLLSSVLGLIAVLGCVHLWQQKGRRSGLTADVKGVAGIAAMANRSHILMDFRDLDTAKPGAIHQRLKKHRYVLQNSSLAPDTQVPLTESDKDKYDKHRLANNPHPLMLRLVAGIPFILGMIAFMGFVPVVLFTEADEILIHASWFLTALAVCIKLVFMTLDNDLRMMEPFYKLSCRHQPPRVLTLDYTSMAFGYMPVRALLNGDVLMCLVGLGSVLAEVLTVCVTSFSGVSGAEFLTRGPAAAAAAGAAGAVIDAGEETFASFWVSFALFIAILIYLCAVSAVVYHRRRHPFLPRQPSTIASVLAFIHQSKMLYDFVGTEKLDNDEMVGKLAQIGKTYGLGWFTGRDGETHCGVDQEELTHSYKHGDDARNASKPWTTHWDTY